MGSAALRLVDQCFEGSWQRRMVVVVAVDSHAGCSRWCWAVIRDGLREDICTALHVRVFPLRLAPHVTGMAYSRAGQDRVGLKRVLNARSVAPSRRSFARWLVT